MYVDIFLKYNSDILTSQTRETHIDTSWLRTDTSIQNEHVTAG